MKHNFTKLFLFLMVVAFPFTSFADTNNAANNSDTTTNWTQFQGNAQHNGYVPITLDPTKFRERWANDLSIKPALTQLGTPIIINDMLYLTRSTYYTNDEFYLLALDVNNGQIKWKSSLNINSTPYDGLTLGDPAYSNNVIVLQTYDSILNKNVLLGFDSTTGNLLYQTKNSQSEGGDLPSSAVTDDTNIYLPDGPRIFYSTNTKSGSIQWVKKLLISGIDPFSLCNNYLILSPDETGIYILDKTTGALLHTISYSSPNNSYSAYLSVIDLNKQLVIVPRVDSNSNEYLDVFDLNALKLKYTTTIPQGNIINNSPSEANNIIYESTNNDVVALDEDTGKVLWLLDLEKNFNVTWQPIVVTNNILFISGRYIDDNQKVLGITYAVDLTTHKIVWQMPVGGTLALSNNTLFIIERNATVHAINLS